tara:strand:+ start:244 stop:354 length:111 start_codon:yes stop_codon:yes gene_type:complete
MFEILIKERYLAEVGLVNRKVMAKVLSGFFGCGPIY